MRYAPLPSSKEPLIDYAHDYDQCIWYDRVKVESPAFTLADFTGLCSNDLRLSEGFVAVFLLFAIEISWAD